MASSIYILPAPCKSYQLRSYAHWRTSDDAVTSTVAGFNRICYLTVLVPVVRLLCQPHLTCSLVFCLLDLFLHTSSTEKVGKRCTVRVPCLFCSLPDSGSSQVDSQQQLAQCAFLSRCKRRLVKQLRE